MTLWENWNKRLEFLENITVEELRLHVGFLYFLGSPIEVDYWRAQQFRNGNIESGNQLIADFQKITKGLDESYFWSEQDVNANLFSIDYYTSNNKKILLNTDVLRTQVDITNLINFNLLNKVDSIVEVGSGYGHLALAILKLFPRIKYTIVDYSQQLKIVSRYLKYNGIDSSFESNCQVRLVDQNRIHDPINCDLLVNVNSFCEMSTDTVTNYVNQTLIKYKTLYSNNREIQFMNKDLDKSLSTILSENGYLYPSLKDYLKHENKFHKFVFLTSPDSKFNGARLCPISEIVGISDGGNLAKFVN